MKAEKLFVWKQSKIKQKNRTIKIDERFKLELASCAVATTVDDDMDENEDVVDAAFDANDNLETIDLTIIKEGII